MAAHNGQAIEISGETATGTHETLVTVISARPSLLFVDIQHAARIVKDVAVGGYLPMPAENNMQWGWGG
jgi:hypothetical protein